MLNEANLTDRLIVCCDCSNTFEFTKGEQKYFLLKGLQLPKRCPQCRLKRKLTLVREGGEA